jgi:hypothetical protein
MHRFRFNLLSLFAFVAAVAVACAALARPSQFWLAVISSLTVASLFYAILAVIYGRAGRRAFWVGFAVFAWGYVALEWGAEAGMPFRLPTGQVTDQLQSAMHGEPAPNNAAWLAYYTAANNNQPVTFIGSGTVFDSSGNVLLGSAVDHREEFRWIGRWLWSPLLGFIGGVVALRLYQKRERHPTRDGQATPARPASP